MELPLLGSIRNLLIWSPFWIIRLTIDLWTLAVEINQNHMVNLFARGFYCAPTHTGKCKVIIIKCGEWPLYGTQVAPPHTHNWNSNSLSDTQPYTINYMYRIYMYKLIHITNRHQTLSDFIGSWLWKVTIQIIKSSSTV